MKTYKEILDYYGFTSFPRVVGNPFQSVVNSYDELLHFIYMNNGVGSVFTGHNQYFEDKLIYEQMLIDIDFKRAGYEQAQLETKELFNLFDEYCKKLTFTGHGYQFYLKFEPFIEHNEKIAVKEFQNKLRMKSIDPDSAKASQLCRIPQTLNVKNKPYLYCIPINYNDLNLSLENLHKKSKKREMSFVDNTGKSVYSNEGMIRHNVTIYSQNPLFKSGYDWLNMPLGNFLDIIQDMLDDGLYDLIMSPPRPLTHPNHNHLFNAVTKIKTIGYPVEETKMIFDKLALLSKWDRQFRDNQKERHKQIEQIYRGNYVYTKF